MDIIDEPNALKAQVRAISKGDKKAFQELYNCFYPDLYRFSISIVKVSEWAEDIVHEVFVKIWENRAQLDAQLSLKSYLFTICRNLSINVLKKIAVENRLQEIFINEYPTVVEACDYENLLYTDEKLAKEALESLPSQRRQVFELAKLQDLSYEQIAQKLGISKGTVSDHIVKANRFLRQYFLLKKE